MLNSNLPIIFVSFYLCHHLCFHILVHLDAEIDEDKETDTASHGIDRPGHSQGIIDTVRQDGSKEDLEPVGERGFHKMDIE